MVNAKTKFDNNPCSVNLNCFLFEFHLTIKTLGTDVKCLVYLVSIKYSLFPVRA